MEQMKNNKSDGKKSEISKLIEKDKIKEIDEKKKDVLKGISEDIEKIAEVENKINKTGEQSVKLISIVNFIEKTKAIGIPILVSLLMMFLIWKVVFSDEWYRASGFGSSVWLITILLCASYVFVMMKCSIRLYWLLKDRDKEEVAQTMAEKKNILNEFKTLFEKMEYDVLESEMRKFNSWREYEFTLIADNYTEKLTVEMV